MTFKRTILITALLAAFAVPAAAQVLPSLGKAKEITVGELPNGVSYYLVSNKSYPGFADFAIVQPSRPASSNPREDLESLPHFRGRKPYRFLAGIGVGYGERGFIRSQRDAVVMRFANVPLSNTSAADSVLLMLTDISVKSPSRQAIIVSGDIDVAATAERLRLLSMTVSPRTSAENPYAYEWQPRDSTIVTTATGPVGTVRLTYRSPRTDPELMNTIQPVMSDVLASEFEIVLRQRVRAAFSAAGIPLADFRYNYIGSDSTAGDELFIIGVDTAPGSLKDAVSLLAGVLSGLDSGGVTTEETVFARSIVNETLARDSRNTTYTNAHYLDRCISAYLYGANLASPSSLQAFFKGRRLDVNRERELLSRYISATVSASRNLHIHARSTVKPVEKDIKESFEAGWKNGSSVQSDIPSPADTMNFKIPRSKVQLKSTSSDSFSGGKMWTFSNGMSVIFKKTADKGAFHFGYMVRGGWTEISGITGAESSFASDASALESVAGMSGEHFRNLLAMNGITLNSEVLLSDLRYTGIAPSNRLQLVLKSILALATTQEADAAAWEIYRSEEAVRTVRDRFTPAGTRAELDSTMSPQYRYSSGSSPAIPGSNFPVRVNSYITNKCLNSSNSTLVLAGDLDEAATLKLLGQILGGFPNGKQRVSRPRFAYPLRQCWTTANATGGWRDRGVTVSLSAMWPYTASDNTLLQLGCATLEAGLAEALADKGYRFSVYAHADLLPAEKATIYIHCYPVGMGGLPASVSAVSPAVALDAVRSVVNRLATVEVTPATLARAKAAVSGMDKASDTAKLLNLILYRTSLGRETGNNRSAHLASLGASDVLALFAAMDDCKCEFTVQ